MAQNSTLIEVEAQKVFAILLDAAVYPAWVAGTKRLAWAEPTWPAPGSGFWIKFAAGIREDKTEVVDVQGPGRIILRPHIRPFAVTRVVLDLEERDGATQISLTETLEWPSRPRLLRTIADMLLFIRNIEALRRLKRLVERQAISDP